MAKNNNNKDDRKTKNRQSGKRSNNKSPKSSGKSGDSSNTKNNCSPSNVMNTGNDPGWYTGNQQLIHDVIRVPWSYPTGMQLPFGSAISKSIHTGTAGTAVPGIMVFDTILLYGEAESAMSPLNMASYALWQKVRRNLSTTNTSYEPADLMVSIAAVDSIFSLYYHIVRLFGIANQYSALNKYYPMGLVKAMYGIGEGGFRDLVDHFNDYRAKFNKSIARASSIYMPVLMPITQRHAWLFANYFVDSDSIKSQIYAYAPEFVYKFDETTFDTGSALTPTIDLRGLGISELIDIFDSLIEAIRMSSSILDMFADMERAFQSPNLFTLAYVDEQFTLLPTYSELVLQQIHNSNIIPVTHSQYAKDDKLNKKDKNFNIHQDMDHLILKQKLSFELPINYEDDKALTMLAACGLYGHTTLNVAALSGGASTITGDSNIILDAPRLAVTDDEILEMTRNITTMKGDFSIRSREDGTVAVLEGNFSVTCPTADLMTRCWIAMPEFDGPSHTITNYVLHELASNVICTNYGADELSSILAMASKFDWAPTFYVVSQYWTEDEGRAESPLYIAPIGDWTNVSYVSVSELEGMNNSIMLSMMGVPQITTK